ncbi:unnamed protein product [Clonostachys rhizophaga]|uniref:NAD(P)-binding domain-containing protein n=1 Tax=Clonostachys rhizophaga TaxID=160324 RepID=A0A9N9YRZ8_9HYPO|nr:unnamed protein product [Clonostachys rhizophaga]
MSSTKSTQIAVFGATGGTGSATVRSLLKRHDSLLELRLMVRSRAKLFGLIPELHHTSNLIIHEGQLTDTAIVRSCVENADIIICTIGENDNIPGCRPIQDIAKSIIDALQELKSSSLEWKLPRVILLSSSTWNERFASHEGTVVNWLLKTAFYHPYLDLRLATAMFEASSELLSLLLVQPSALVQDEPSGMAISAEWVSVAVSYADLGEGFAELALEESYARLGAVGVSSKGAIGGEGLRKYGFELFSRIIRGFVLGYMPGYWPIKNYMNRR